MLPTKPLLLALGCLLVFGLVYVYLGDVIESCIWSMTHGSTATYVGWPDSEYEGFSVKVPWMWRQEPGLGSDKGIQLVRAHVGIPFAPGSVLIRRVDSPGDVLKRMEVFTPEARDKFAKVGIAVRVEPIPIDSDVAVRFSCISTHVTKSGWGPVHCASTDGKRWFVAYIGFGAKDNLSAVLRNLQ
jgi:hypothetical protein